MVTAASIEVSEMQVAGSERADQRPSLAPIIASVAVKEKTRYARAIVAKSFPKVRPVIVKFAVFPRSDVRCTCLSCQTFLRCHKYSVKFQLVDRQRRLNYQYLQSSSSYPMITLS